MENNATSTFQSHQSCLCGYQNYSKDNLARQTKPVSQPPNKLNQACEYLTKKLKNCNLSTKTVIQLCMNRNNQQIFVQIINLYHNYYIGQQIHSATQRTKQRKNTFF